MWRFLKKLKIELPYDSAIALLGIYPRDTGVLFQRGTCTLMFIAALSAIAKVWKEPKCPSMDEWIKNMHTHARTHTHTHARAHTHTHTHTYTHIHNEILLGDQKNEILAFGTTWMELEGIMLSAISQSETDKYHMTSLV